MPSKYEGEVDFSGTPLEPPPGIDPDCLLFLGDPKNKTVSEFQRGWMPISGATAMLIGSIWSNKAARLPMRAGLYKHILSTAFGLFVGEGAWRFSQKYAAEKDIQYYHYMILHPEDFQAPEKKKWADTIRPWIPMR